jgi:hypothetical protein
MPRSTFPQLQKHIQITHNRIVKKHFKDLEKNTTINSDNASNARLNLRNELLVKSTDSAIIVNLKLTYFRDYISQLEGGAIATLPDRWSIKPINDIPELVIIFRDTSKKSRTGNYTLHIPHYNGNKNPIVTSYDKGNYHGSLILKDNSRLEVNAKSDFEAKKVLNQLKKYVEPKYLNDEFHIVPRKGKKLKEFTAKPIRADYYPTGYGDTVPKWRHYF